MCLICVKLSSRSSCKFLNKSFGKDSIANPVVGPFGDPEEIQAEQGDLIEFERRYFQHWGMYFGDGFIIHVTNLNGVCVCQKELLVDVYKSGRCRVNNLVFEAKERGLDPLSTNEALKNAYNAVTNKEEIKYDLINYNCEHYVTEWRYGEKFSIQAE